MKKTSHIAKLLGSSSRVICRNTSFEKMLFQGYPLFYNSSLHIKHCYWDGEGKDNAEGHVDPNVLPIVTEIKKTNSLQGM